MDAIACLHCASVNDLYVFMFSHSISVLYIQVWTFKNRVAFVLSVTDRGEPVRDGIKLARLQQLLCNMMDSQGNGVVNIKAVRNAKQARSGNPGGGTAPDRIPCTASLPLSTPNQSCFAI